MQKPSTSAPATRGTRRTTQESLLVAAVWLLAAIQVVTACQGQSGSEATGSPGPINNDSDLCPCAAVGIYLRVTVLEAAAGELTLRVEELIHGATELRVGDEIRARFRGRLPCQLGETSIGEGQEGLAVFQPDEQDAGGCDASDCARRAPARGEVSLTPWSGELLMARTAQASLRVPSAEVARLWGDRDQCLEAYGDSADLPGASDSVAR